MAKSVSTEANVGQRHILVKSLEKDRFDVFREEIVAKFHLLNVFVILESVDKENQASIIDSAGWEIKPAQIAWNGLVGYNISEEGHDIVTKKVLVTHQIRESGFW